MAGDGLGRDWTSLKAWASAIGVVGIPGTIAVFLVYVGATEIPRLTRVQEATIIEVRKNQEMLDKAIQRFDQQLRMLQRICSTVAKNDEQRERCFDD